MLQKDQNKHISTCLLTIISGDTLKILIAQNLHTSQHHKSIKSSENSDTAICEIIFYQTQTSRTSPSAAVDRVQ